MPQGEVDTLMAYYQQIVTIARAELESIVRGRHADLASLRRDMSDDDDLANWLVNQVLIAVKTGRTKWGVPLDFTAASLSANLGRRVVFRVVDRAALKRQDTAETW